jgi:hypothetical protein
MMLALVDRVPADPFDGAHPRRGPVVDAGALPAVAVEGLEGVRKRLRRFGDLSSDLLRGLVVVPLLDDAFLSPHGREIGAVLGERQQRPLALHSEHVSHVAGVLQRRPRLRNRMRPEGVVVRLGEHGAETPRKSAESIRDVVASDRVVHEAARVAAVHTTTLDGRAATPGMMAVVDVGERVKELLEAHRDVQQVALTGSRARGGTTALSDWDFHVDTTDPVAFARDLPALVGPLEPLAAQWDRLAEHATYMLVLPGPVKVDLILGNQPHEIEPPWKPASSNLAAIDAHFWDWVLWLGSKALHGHRDLVEAELRKLHYNLLGPLGVATGATTIGAAVKEYRSARDRLERRWSISIDRRLGDQVSLALEDNHAIDEG